MPEHVYFHLDSQNRESHFNNFVNHINNVYHNEELVNFLTTNKEGFYDNIVNKEYECSNTKIPKGMKLVKAFKFFEKDKEVLTTLQDQASQVIQQDKIEGTLCFSVHPLDFLSISTNTYYWRSCHALDGEYRAGNLSYMSDSSTIVCYLKGANDCWLPSFPEDVPWNSKKWRVLLYLSDNWDLIFASKQYPFSSETGLNIALEHLCAALKINPRSLGKWSRIYASEAFQKLDKPISLKTDYLPFRGRLYGLDEIIKEPDNSLHFNDLIRSSTYHRPYYAIKDNHWWSDCNQAPKVRIGNRVKCLCCENKDISGSEFMACNSCVEKYDLYCDDEGYYVCDCCGSRIFEGQYFTVMGEILCENCYEQNVFTCACCDREYFIEDQRYDKKLNRYICVDCYEG